MNCFSLKIAAFLIGCGLVEQSLGAAIPIGLVIESDRTTEISAVTYAVQFANANLLTGTADTLSLTILTIQPNDSASAIQQTCSLISIGVISQIGPAGSSNVGAVAPFLESLNIPLIAPVATNALLGRFNYTIHMVPSDVEQGRAIASIMLKMVWTRFHIMTSDDQYGTTGLLSFVEMASTKGWHIASYRVIILNCLGWQSKYILNAANINGMTGHGWMWIVTDGSTNNPTFLPPAPVPDHLQGVLGTGFPTAYGGMAAQFQNEWAGLDPVVYSGAGTAAITSSVARWVDAVLAVAYAVRDYGTAVVPPSGLQCNGNGKWTGGHSFLQTITNVNQTGVAQNIQFTGTYPTVTKYVVLNSRPTGWMEVASWDPVSGYQPVPGETIILAGGLPVSPDFISKINGKHLMIATCEGRPFVFYKNKTKPVDLTNVNAGTEVIGYGVDMMVEIARILNFTYTMYMVPDGKYGVKNTTSGAWNGLMAELISGNADFAFALTVTNAREEAIDFTTPWIDIGLDVALPKEEAAVNIFEFIQPFHAAVWYFVGGTMILIGVVLSILEKLSPYGYHGEFIHAYHDIPTIHRSKRSRRLHRRECKEALDVMRVDNAIWFSTASLIQQGYDKYPQSVSARIVALSWFLGVVAITSIYTGQLGAVLISSRLKPTIKSLEDLYAQDRIRYGVVKDTSHETFFCNSNMPLYKNMCLKMREWDSFVTGGAPQVMGWMADPNYLYAFISETSVIEAVIGAKPCSSRKLGLVFAKGGFSVGLQKGSVYNEIMSTIILQLRESGFIGVFYVFVVAACISPILIAAEFTYSCIEHQRRSAEEGAPIGLLRVIRVRIGRMIRDFKIYMLPEGVKSLLGMQEYTRKRQVEVYKEQLLRYKQTKGNQKQKEHVR